VSDDAFAPIPAIRAVRIDRLKSEGFRTPALYRVDRSRRAGSEALPEKRAFSRYTNIPGP